MSEHDQEEQLSSFSVGSGIARFVIVVLSGKGGVGKSTVAANLAVGLSLQGHEVGLLDMDFHGPSIPGMLGLKGSRLGSDGESRIDPAMFGSLRVVSIDFLLQNRDDAVIWRGPMKAGIARQLLESVEWGDLDYLVVDSPPGTGDEPLSIAQLISDPAGALIVTTAQGVSTDDVSRSITFCRRVELPVLGVVENMSGMQCPHCGGEIELFGTGGGEKMAAGMGVDFLGRIPFDPGILSSSDQGRPFVYFDSESSSNMTFGGILEKLIEAAGKVKSKE